MSVGLSGAFAWAGGVQPSVPPDSGPPRFVNMVYQTVRPGRGSAYQEVERVIAREYARLQIPAYWLQMQSMTGRPVMLALNLFDTFDEAQRAVSGIGAATAANPDLARQQEELLTAITDERTILTVRRGDIGAVDRTVDLATSMRVLRVTTVTVLPGQETEVAAGLRTACARLESTQPAARCLVYEAEAGVENPTFVLLAPFRSLADLGSDVAMRHGLSSTAAAGVGTPDQSASDLTKAACSSGCTAVGSEIYVVRPELSHMPVAFTARDPSYWSPPEGRGQAPR